MNAAKYLFPLWAGILIYASLTVLFGVKGFSAHRQLEREQIKQETNIESLVRINMELENTINSLLYDRDTLAVYARELGFASGSERFVRIVGLGLSQNTRTFAGEVVVAAKPQYTPEQIIRMIAIGTGLVILFCIALSDLLRHLKDR